MPPPPLDWASVTRFLSKTQPEKFEEEEKISTPPPDSFALFSEILQLFILTDPQTRHIPPPEFEGILVLPTEIDPLPLAFPPLIVKLSRTGKFGEEVTLITTW